MPRNAAASRSSCSWARAASTRSSRHSRSRRISLLTGPLEPTNEWYAIAKIAGVKLCQALRREYGFNAISLMPTNLYGPGDNFDLQEAACAAGVTPADPRGQGRAARRASPFGERGTPRREFLHVDDLADAVLYLLHDYDGEPIVNVGWGKDITDPRACGTHGVGD